MHVTIIGGGVIGLSCAYRMARDGAKITLVDARPTGRGASEANAGWICPAEAAPVPAPGLVRQAMRWMLRPDSPLYIRPSLEPSFIAFMLRMWRHCNLADYRAGMERLLRLADGTMDGFDAYRDDGIEFEMHATGLLMVFKSADRLAEHQRNLDIAESFGLQPRVLETDAVREQEPALSGAVAGGIYFPLERSVDPAALMRGLHRRCLELGVDIVEGVPVDEVERDTTHVTAVRAGTRRFTSDAFVLAGGAWSGPLSRLFGVELPVRPGKGYYVDLPRSSLRSPIYLSDARVAVTPLEDRLRLAGTMEFGRLDERVDRVRVAAIAKAPRTYFRDWPSAPERDVGAGARPMTPDGLPIIGALGTLRNVFVSTGHAMLGVTLAPASAAALSDLVLASRASPVLAPFRPERFLR